MSENTKIEWADSTWSPWRGCTKVSEGCAHCYAETLAKRNPAVLGGWGKGAPRVLNKDWNAPRRWSKRMAPLLCENAIGEKFTVSFPRKKIFPSLCDWLDEDVPIEWLARFLELIHDTPNLDWLLLTKRPDNWHRRMTRMLNETKLEPGKAPWSYHKMVQEWCEGSPPSNVWFGVSVENQKRADERIPLLLQIPAALRWLSLEPLLGPVDLTNWIPRIEVCPRCTPPTDPGCPYCLGNGWLPFPSDRPLHWLVIGGESGAGARPCNVEWIRSLVQQGSEAAVPVFVKQLGQNVRDRNDRGFEGDSGPSCWPMDTHTQDLDQLPIYQGKPVRIMLRSKKGGDPAEWPADLRVRQMPLAQTSTTP